MLSNVTLAPDDPILGLTDVYTKDKNPGKINLGVGVYKNEKGVTPILRTVKVAEKMIYEKEITKSYLSIQGTPEYGKLVQKLIFGGSSNVFTENRLSTVQTPGGTGALRIAAEFIHKFNPTAEVWISNPSWANHRQIFETAGMKVNQYDYYDPEIKGLNFEKMLNSLHHIPAGDVVIFHACCHNPTGADPNKNQWKQLAKLAIMQNIFVLFDFAYQGFDKGLIEDAFAIRYFASKLPNFLVANSFSKNFGLYNERVGALTCVSANADIAKKVFSQLKICSRVNFSNPPAHGAAIVTKILSTPELNKRWQNEVAEMRERISEYREIFVKTLTFKKCKHNFNFINEQKGMFSYTGITQDKVEELKSKHSIYFLNSGRISLAGINKMNVDRLCNAFTEVLN